MFYEKDFTLTDIDHIAKNFYNDYKFNKKKEDISNKELINLLFSYKKEGNTLLDCGNSEFSSLLNERVYKGFLVREIFEPETNSVSDIGGDFYIFTFDSYGSCITSKTIKYNNILALWNEPLRVWIITDSVNNKMYLTGKPLFGYELYKYKLY